MRTVAGVMGASVGALAYSVVRPPPPGCRWEVEIAPDGFRVSVQNTVICVLYFIWPVLN